MPQTHLHPRATNARFGAIVLGAFAFSGSAHAQVAAGTPGEPAPATTEPPAPSPAPTAPSPALVEPSPAPATPTAAFGSKNQLTASVWRLYGASVDFQRVDLGGGQSESIKTFTLSLLGTDAPKPYFIPRLGGDWFVTDHVSVGASGMFVLTSPQGNPSATFFVANPRVGYADSFNRTFSFWVTAGVTYSRWQTTDMVLSPTSPTITQVDHVESGLAASIDAMLVVHPVGNFGFTVGPAADIAFAGNSEVTRTWRSIGLMGGLVAWL